jgi:flagellar M-ring protein FliF
VARSRVLDARMMLSAEGLPSRGSVGYEIFDSPEALGQTQFQQNINRLRALEGELARTIGSLEGVAAARVHLVLPERQLFSRETEHPSASIVLKLRRETLDPGQVRAVRNLVASATPGMTLNRVTVLDDTGRLLAAASSGEDGDIGGETVDARQSATEERIRRTVTDLVEGVVGVGNARVQVSADMDFNRVVVNTLRYDPEGRVVVSSSTSEETGASTDGGSPQATTAGANIPDGAGGQDGAAGAATDSSNRSQETINYENSSTTTQEIREGGQIKRLSVAVAVDGVWTPGEGEGAEATWAPRPAEELQQITALVRSAIGFTDTEARRDAVEVVNVRFARADVGSTEFAEPGMFDNLDLMRIIEIVSALVASLAFVFFVLRPLVGGLVRGQRIEALPDGTAIAPAGALPPPHATALPAREGDAIAAALQGDGAAEPSIDIAQIHGRVRASSVKRVAEVIEQHPDESVQIIRGWLNNAM